MKKYEKNQLIETEKNLYDKDGIIYENERQTNQYDEYGNVVENVIYKMVSCSEALNGSIYIMNLD